MSDATLEARLRGAWFKHPVIAFVRHRRLMTFYQQLHALIRAGVALPTAFAQLTAFAPDAAMARGLGEVAKEIQRGETLGSAMRKHQALFDDANVELIAFAEEAGRLEPVCAGIISHLERVQALRWQTVMGALWPMYLGAAVTFVGPLLDVAQQYKPGHSILGLYLTGLLSSVGLAVFVLLAVLGAPFAIAALGREVEWDRFRRRLPLVSAPMRQLAASRFVLGLGLAIASGMETVRSLRLAVKATASASLLADLPRVEAQLRAGASLTQAVTALQLLDQSSLGILVVAEMTGTLDEALQRLSRELQEASLRAMRFLVLVITGLVITLLLVKVAMGILGVLLGPLKTLYEAAGSGNLEG